MASTAMVARAAGAVPCWRATATAGRPAQAALHDLWATAETKAAPRDPSATAEQQATAAAALRQMTRDASPTRLRSRDAVDGWPPGCLRVFVPTRIRLREPACRGDLPEVGTSFW